MSRRLGTKKRRVLVEALIERDGMWCTWCCRSLIDAPVVPDQDCNAHITIEHIRPVVLGGTNDMSNLALACFACNNARGASVDWCHEDSGVTDSCVL